MGQESVSSEMVNAANRAVQTGYRSGSEKKRDPIVHYHWDDELQPRGCSSPRFQNQIHCMTNHAAHYGILYLPPRTLDMLGSRLTSREARISTVARHPRMPVDLEPRFQTMVVDWTSLSTASTQRRI